MKHSIQHRTVEVLEQKRMNAANLIGNAMAAAPAASSTIQAAAATTGSIDASAAAANTNVAGSTRLSADLTGSGAGTLKLASGSANGSANANLVLHLSGAPASQTFDVSIGGNVVGSISTNAQGSGLLHLNSALNNAGDLLAVLPSIGANASVSVGVSGETPILTGTLEASAHVGASIGDVSSVVDGALAKVSSLEDAVVSKVNSLVDKLDARADHSVDSVLAVVNKLENVSDRLLGRVDNLTASLVDKVFSTVDDSALLSRVDSILPINLSSLT